MANKKITDLNRLNEAPANNDLVHIVDVSDTTDGAEGTSKKVSREHLRAGTTPESWASWTPTYSASSSMTYTSVTTTSARYVRVGNIVYFSVEAFGTVGGTPHHTLKFTLPIEASHTYHSFSGFVVDSTAELAFSFMNNSTTTVDCRRNDSSNFTAGDNKQLRISGFYEVDSE